MSVYQGTWRRWVSAHEVLLTLTTVVAFTLLVIAVCYSLISQMWPAVATMTTRHNVGYFPARYELVQDVTNVFRETRFLGGAGGVGSPQVEVSLDMYKRLERPAVHYLSISSEGATTSLNYYDFQGDKVIHSKAEFDSPSFVGPLGGHVVGYWAGRSANLEGNQLVVQRSYQLAGGYYSVMVLVFLVGIVVWMVGITIAVSAVSKRW